MSPRSLQRDDRRRRALVDEVRNDSEVTRPRIYRGDSSGPTHRYNKAALDAINAPISKYIPLRPYYLVVWFLVGLLVVMGLLLADTRVWQIRNLLGDSAARAFQLEAPGSLMAWCSSITFGFAVAIMLGTYSVRRYRRDDYRGKFTVWRWAIGCAVLISVDASTGLHNTFQQVCQLVTQTTIWGDGKIWWVGTLAVVMGGMLIKLMFEMASSRLAVGWAAMAGLCYAWSACMELDLAPRGVSPHAAGLSKLSALMLGHHFMLFSLVNYAREVVLEAMGLVDSPAVKRKKAEAAKAEKTAQKQRFTEKVSSTPTVPETKSDQKINSDQKVKSDKETTPAAETIVTKAASRRRSNNPEKIAAEAAEPQLRAISAVDSTLDTENMDPQEIDPAQETPSAQEEKPTLSILGVDNVDVDTPKLSKAERRRLRKEQRKKKRAA